MAFLQVQFYSDTLTVASSVYVILPEPRQGIGMKAAAADELPRVLYLLHGYSDDHTIWMRRTSVERYAAEYNLAVIMPAVNHSFYTNEAQGERYWDYVSEELPAVMHRFFRLSKKPEDTFVAGLSMGGYGAMKLALTYPERFAAAASFSGAVDVAADVDSKSGERLEGFRRVFGDPAGIRGSDNDLFHLLEKNAKAPHRPRLYVCCGVADFLYDQHLRFVPALKEHGWDVEHYEEPGTTHEWRFWDERIRYFIPWAMNPAKK